MTGDACVEKVMRALQAIAGVDTVTVSLSAGVATVLYDEHVTSPEEFKSAVERAGYGGAVTMPLTFIDAGQGSQD